MKRFLCALAAWVLLVPLAFPAGTDGSAPVPQDEGISPSLLFRHEATARQMVLAAGETVCDNLLVMGWNVIVKDRDWAKVNLSTMKANLSKDWLWDNNTFFMNQIGHPYHGSLYFTSARSNNLNYLESLAMAAAGSLMWEMFMEVGAPSVNDFITTTTAGAVIGEIVHRLSFEAYDVLPLFGWILSPVNAITQLVTGDRARRPVGTLWRNDWYAGGGTALTRFSYGGTSRIPAHGPLIGFGFDVIYGNPYGHGSRELYDQFRVRGDVLTAPGYRFFRLFMDGSLLSLQLAPGNAQDTSVALTFNYDILQVEDISLSAGSAGGAVRMEVPFSASALRWNAEADYIFLGVPDAYFLLNADTAVTALRGQPAYTYRHGPEVRLGMEFSHGTAGTFALDAQAMLLLPYSGTSRDPRFDGRALIIISEARYEHAVWRNISLGISGMFYHKTDWCTDIPTVSQDTGMVRAYAKFSFR